MESVIIKKEKIRVIRRINDILIMYQSRILSTDDFDMLIDLEIDDLYNVEQELINQSRELDSSHSKA